jgi:hypothetical protein
LIKINDGAKVAADFSGHKPQQSSFGGGVARAAIASRPLI